MVLFFVGTVTGIGICAAFCGAIIFLGMLGDVPEPERHTADKLRRRAFYQALYAAAKEHPVAADDQMTTEQLTRR